MGSESQLDARDNMGFTARTQADWRQFEAILEQENIAITSPIWQIATNGSCFAPTTESTSGSSVTKLIFGLFPMIKRLRVSTQVCN